LFGNGYLAKILALKSAQELVVEQQQKVETQDLILVLLLLLSEKLKLRLTWSLCASATSSLA
jgi:hypothetical protein